MENDKDYYSTFKFYDDRERRLSIFGEVAGDTLLITVITCSNKDIFSKKVGRALYENFTAGADNKEVHPQTFVTEIKDSKPKQSFLQWCKENYYRHRYAMMAVEGRVLAKGKDILTNGIFEKVKRILSS